MEKITVRFKRVAAAFDEGARMCESSGSEHSPDHNDLSAMVNSFMEKDIHYYKHDDDHDESKMKIVCNDIEMSGVDDDGDDVDRESTNDDDDDNLLQGDSEAKKALRKLIGGFDDGDDAKRDLCDAVERVISEVDGASEGFKRDLMTRLRERGLDAGLCKSKWEKTGSIPAGTYEYIDVNISGTRYIVEPFLAGQFEIAKPTKRYASYIDMLPEIYVGKTKELKQLLKQMCTALRDSMRKVGMRVPPWRKNGYMQAKWFGAYKRTTNVVSDKISSPSKDNIAKKQLVIGFDQAATSFASSGTYYSTCRDDYASGKRAGLLKVGYLAAALNGNVMQL